MAERGQRFGEQLTPNGHRCDEAASALQKSIRRGEEREALYWASELDLGGYGGYVFKRLRIIASEDVGLASTETVIAVRALYENWNELRKTVKPAVRRICPSVPGARGLPAGASAEVPRAPCPGRHLRRRAGGARRGPRPRARPAHRHGPRMGRGYEHFVDVGAQLANEAGVDDPYGEEARQELLRLDEGRRPQNEQLEL